MRGLSVLAAASLVAVAACSSATSSPPETALSADPSAAVSPSHAPSAIASASPNTSPSPSQPPSPSLSPAVSPSGGISPSPVAPPTVGAFWQAVQKAVSEAGKASVTIDGPAPGELRYEPASSATAIEGAVTFVCVGGEALDGQSGWMPVPGDWTCGPGALVRGFRTIGQPLDAWSAALPKDGGIKESIDVTSGGRWRWTYRARSPFAGSVTTRVIVDPASGRIASASRSDGAGTTDYSFDYEADFPTITAP